MTVMSFGSCTKETCTAPTTNIQANDEWPSSYATPASGSARFGNRHTDLRMVIRKVNNTTNKYRMVLKVDSVEMTIDTKTYMVNVPSETKVTAGLSMKDPKNPDKEIVFFEKGQLTFTKENENRVTVYVGEPFVSDIPFTYELVNVSLKLETNFAILLGKPLNENYDELHMVMENGKTIQQDPTIEKYNFNVKSNGKITGNVTISGDIAMGVPYLKIELEAIVITGLSIKPAYDPIEMVRTHFNKETGVARYEIVNGRWDGEYSEGKQPGFATIYPMSVEKDKYFDKAVKVDLWEIK
jgi:hypothetical protein